MLFDDTPIYFKEWMKTPKLLSNEGFCLSNSLNWIEKLDPQYYNYETDLYCDEANIINKIKENSDNYFDFSKNIIDIGACVGVYSFLLPFNYSYCFEPNRKNNILLQFNMMLHNKTHQFECYDWLLSDCNKYIQYDGFYNSGSKELLNEDYTNMKSHYLDELDLNNIGFIKIDVEGMEEQVLRGAINTIKNNNYPPILFELWDVGYMGMTQEKHDSLEIFLAKELGYKILWYWGDQNTHLAIHNKE